MTVRFETHPRQPDFTRYREQWEAGLLAGALYALADMEDHERHALIRSWILGAYNGAAHGVYAEQDPIAGRIEWVQAGPTQYDCLYEGPLGLKCALGRVYQQPDGSWGALVIAGVKDDYLEAIGAAEWALTKLCA